MSLKSHKELTVWQKAMDLVVSCYCLTESFPKDSRFELTSQIRRAAVSIPSNIAEGFHRHSTPAYINHLRIALGSQAELETQLELAVRLRHSSVQATAPTMENLDHVGRMLHRLVTALEKIRAPSAERREPNTA